LEGRRSTPRGREVAAALYAEERMMRDEDEDDEEGREGNTTTTDQLERWRREERRERAHTIQEHSFHKGGLFYLCAERFEGTIGGCREREVYVRDGPQASRRR
jgi:hypothetical protein